MKCHICKNETDFCCRDCEEPVCEGCCVKMTYQNQIDYTLCQECNDANEAQKERFYLYNYNNNL